VPFTTTTTTTTTIIIVVIVLLIGRIQWDDECKCYKARIEGSIELVPGAEGS
jgi:hypothetical protein